MDVLRRSDFPLTDGRIVLRPWRAGDAPAIAAATRDGEIARFTGWRQGMDEAEALTRIDRAAAQLRSGSRLELAITDQDGRLLGHCGLRPLGPRGLLEVFYWIAADARRDGVASSAVTMLCDWAFDRLGARRIELHADVENPGSQAVARHCGFRREAVVRAYREAQDGSRPDGVRFALERWQ